MLSAMPSLRLKHYNMKVEEAILRLRLSQISIDEHNKAHLKIALLPEVGREFRPSLRRKGTRQRFLQLGQAKAKKK